MNINNKTKILIIGSCGFVLGNFIRRLVYNKKPYQIVSVDKVNSNSINSVYWNKSHTFHIANVADKHIMDVIFQFEKPDIVIYGASDNEDFLTANVVGAQVVIDLCLKHNTKNFLYISTAGVYGNNPDLCREDSPLNPTNSISASKVAGEFLIKAASKSHGLNYNIVRMSNVYGPRQSVENIIPRIMKCFLNEKNIEIKNGLQSPKDWIYVGDACDAILSILENGKVNETYNIASNQELYDIEVSHKLCSLMNKDTKLVSSVNGEEGIYCKLDLSKIKGIGWSPAFKFKEAISTTFEWYLNNKWYLK